MQSNKSAIHRRAVCTRKSSEEGLEQNFNPLQAQREACEAFIQSQADEGWRLIETDYDDGGVSGGTMERPALRRLLDEPTWPYSRCTDCTSGPQVRQSGNSVRWTRRLRRLVQAAI